MSHARIAGLFVGAVETFEARDGRPLRTGIRKKPVEHARLEFDGFAGDASADREHRTPEKAVHLFPAEYYAGVEARLAVTLPRPAFGENITTTALTDEAVCVGDVLRIGEVRICITQPTERCRVIGRSLGLPKILKALHELEICGCYARVLRPGRIAASDTITLEHRAQQTWTIRRLHRFMFQQLTDEALAAEVLAEPSLSVEWKARVEVMRARARRGEPLSSNLVDI